MISHHSVKFGGYRNCGSGDMIFLVFEGLNSCLHFNLPLLFISKTHSMPCSHTRNLMT